MTQTQKIENQEIREYFPKEILNQINDSTLFLYAEIGKWEGDFLNNKLFQIYNNGTVFKTVNKELPRNSLLRIKTKIPDSAHFPSRVFYIY